MDNGTSIMALLERTEPSMEVATGDQKTPSTLSSTSSLVESLASSTESPAESSTTSSASPAKSGGIPTNIMGELESASSFSDLVDTPVAEPVPAQEGFPREFEWMALRSATGGHSCAECGNEIDSQSGNSFQGGNRFGGGSGGTRAVVGGVEFVTGGWGRYRIDQRHARRGVAGMRLGAVYGGGSEDTGRKHVYARDCVRVAMGGGDGKESVMGQGPLQRAGEHLAKALGRMEDALCDPSGDGIWECAEGEDGIIAAPALTSENVRQFIADEDATTSPSDLASMAEDATTVAALIGTYVDALPPLEISPAMPPLPARAVAIDDDDAVMRLESAVIPYVETLEKYQGAVATLLDSVATAVDKKMEKIDKRKEAHTRPSSTRPRVR